MRRRFSNVEAWELLVIVATLGSFIQDLPTSDSRLPSRKRKESVGSADFRLLYKSDEKI